MKSAAVGLHRHIGLVLLNERVSEAQRVREDVRPVPSATASDRQRSQTQSNFVRKQIAQRCPSGIRLQGRRRAFPRCRSASCVENPLSGGVAHLVHDPTIGQENHPLCVGRRSGRG